MKLLKLKLQNFKGIRNSEFDFGGIDATIYGDNATGKTTVFDSLCWLLFSKDSLDRADFEIKTLENGKPIHKVNHEVEAEFLNDDGNSFTLRRVYREKYSSPRGGDTKLTGHTTDYFVNDVPVKEKEYKQYINDVIAEDVFKLITNPLYFNEQYSWQNRRKLLLEISGDIKDEEVINSRSELTRLAELLNGRTVDEQRKIVAAKKTAINKELDMIPVRIDEALRNKAALSASEEKLKADIKVFDEAIKKLDEQRSIIINGFNATEKRSKVDEINRRLKLRQSEVLSTYTAEKQRLRGEYELLLNKLKAIESERDRYADRAYDLRGKIERENKRIETLQAEFDVFNSQKFDESICPTCKQPLPADKQAELEAEFNSNKANKLEEYQQLIESAKALKANYEEQQELMAVKADGLINQIEQANSEYEVKFKEYKSYYETNIEDDPEYKGLKAELFLLELDDNDDADTKEVARLESEIKELRSKQSALENELNKYTLNADIQKRVIELENQQQKLATEKNLLDETSFLIDEFVKAKVDMLEESINSHFKYARFKMFNVLVNGNVEECCETTYKGVPYRSMNNAARINVGLDIINALTKFYNVTAPVFIDNAEAVTDFIKCNSQTIKLVVDADFKELTMI
ncbi:AAA family ATPase [Veillonella parvula]|jgi:DNA repair exonuclease SbcCD ATPase subunit|uniref:AAA family ATPase n=1 Tax=Veillonella parvula TaxID=29466 RepID=UPI0022DF66A6|nr:AAA family ATPase [Veillonella parvula]